MILVVRGALRLSAAGFLCALAAGCGSSSSSTHTTRAAKPPPYRVGQYCVPEAGAPYLRYGLACVEDHLRKR
jgi:hypothetical protein